MANGAAVKLPLELDPSTFPTSVSASVSDSATNPSELEQKIGDAAAAAAMAVGGGVGCILVVGRLTAEAKAVGGEALTRLSMLQLTFFGDDTEFAAIAYREGKRGLWRHAGFREIAPQLDPTLREHMFTEFLQGAIEIAGRAVAVERALQAN
jgi:hypothetical protein